MHERTRSLTRALMAATCLIAPGTAHAATEREMQLETRLERLEAEMTQLRSDLAAARQQQARDAASAQSSIAEATAKTEAAATRLASMEALAPVSSPAAPSSKPAGEGLRIGGTTFKFGGFIKVNTIASRWSAGDVAVGTLGKEFYLPQHIPVGGAKSQDFLLSARQTRLSLGTSTPLGGHELKGYIEFDFGLATAPAGTQRSTNPYTPTLRRAWMQFDNILIGQEWSTFMDFATLPETTDFVGPTEGIVFNRQAQIRYTRKLSPELSLSLAIENAETEVQSAATAAFTDLDDDVIPDGVARLDWKPKFGNFALAGLVRQLRAQADGDSQSAPGWGISASGKVPFGPNNRHDLRFMATYGQGIGRYLALGYVADAVQSSPGAPLHPIDNFAAFAALKLGWTAKLRSTVMGGYQWAGYPEGYAVNGLANKSAWSAAANLFWSPVPAIDFGVEYRHGVRETVSGADGALDRLEFAAKYSF